MAKLHIFASNRKPTMSKVSVADAVSAAILIPGGFDNPEAFTALCPYCCRRPDQEEDLRLALQQLRPCTPRVRSYFKRHKGRHRLRCKRIVVHSIGAMSRREDLLGKGLLPGNSKTWSSVLLSRDTQSKAMLALWRIRQWART